MTGATLTCPNCDMMLVTPQPTAAGTLVTCPRCGTCFGVPELGNQVPRAESVNAPAILQARPVAPAVPPPAARAHPPRPKPAAVAPVTDSLNFDEPSSVHATDPPPPATAESSARPRDCKHRHKKNDPMVKWLLIGSGAVLLVAFILVGIVVLPPEKKPHARSTFRDANTPNSGGEEKKAGVNEAAGKPEKRSAAPAHPGNNSKARAAGTDKQATPTAKMAPDNDRDAPIPIPGLGPSKPKQPPPPP